MIKKILLSLVATLMLTGQAWAGACQTALMPAFTEAQANSLCTNLAALNTSLIPKANATYNLGSAALAWRDIFATRNVILTTSGGTISIQEGTPASACMGVSTPNGNTPVAISTTCAVTGSRVFYTRLGNFGILNMGVITTTTNPTGTGFSYASQGNSDGAANSVVWFIVKESA